MFHFILVISESSSIPDFYPKRGPSTPPCHLQGLATQQRTWSQKGYPFSYESQLAIWHWPAGLSKGLSQKENFPKPGCWMRWQRLSGFLSQPLHLGEGQKASPFPAGEGGSNPGVGDSHCVTMVSTWHHPNIWEGGGILRPADWSSRTSNCAAELNLEWPEAASPGDTKQFWALCGSTPWINRAPSAARCPPSPTTSSQTCATWARHADWRVQVAVKHLDIHTPLLDK
jgi:hypothetical protein